MQLRGPSASRTSSLRMAGRRFPKLQGRQQGGRGRVEDQEFARQVAEYLRACVEPDAHRAALAAMECYDVSALLSSVAAPTLVVQNQKSPFAPVQAGQRLAAHIADSRFVLIDDLTYAQLPALIDEFLGEGEP